MNWSCFMNDNLLLKRNIIAIDLKSFYASVECIDRGVDPFTTALVVCDPKRNGAITLAVSPYLKGLGVESRERVYNLPKDIDIIKARPRMNLYISKSKEVINVYLDFIAPEDIYVYSIDEVFLDVTNYLKLYNMTDYELANTIIKRVKEKTGLTTTAGIGPNLLLAKVAMDIEAKHVKGNIAKWDYDDVRDKLWNIAPLSKMWGIGSRLEKRLNLLGLYKVGDIARCDKNLLKEKFGVIGEELWYHSNGIDTSLISELNNYVPKESSISNSQILYKDYNSYNIRIIIREMVDVLVKRLRMGNKQTGLIGFGIGYSRDVGGGFYHSVKLDNFVSDKMDILNICNYIFDNYYGDNMPIRRISISLGNLCDNSSYQISIFSDFNDEKLNKKLNDTIDIINRKYGANAVLNASSLLDDSTIRDRNRKIGGHNAE